MVAYSVPLETTEYTLVVKRSQFIAQAARATCREQAETVIALQRSAHRQASHVCSAYIAGKPNTTIRSMSDDGEPSGTAGKPMLTVLEHSGLGECVLTVVRYFGGTKLGTGGLQRAYGGACVQLLQQLPTQLQVPKVTLQLHAAFAYESLIRHLGSIYKAELLECSYGQGFSAQVEVSCAQEQAYCTALVDQSAGSIGIKSLQE